MTITGAGVSLVRAALSGIAAADVDRPEDLVTASEARRSAQVGVALIRSADETIGALVDLLV